MLACTHLSSLSSTHSLRALSPDGRDAIGEQSVEYFVQPNDFFSDLYAASPWLHPLARFAFFNVGSTVRLAIAYTRALTVQNTSAVPRRPRAAAKPPPPPALSRTPPPSSASPSSPHSRGPTTRPRPRTAARGREVLWQGV